MRGSFKILKGTEKEIYEKIMEHVELMTEGADLLHDTTQDLCRGESVRSGKEADEIVRIESECDDKSQEIIQLIIRKVRKPVLREDLLGLMMSLQRVAKSVEATAYRVKMCSVSDLPPPLKEDLVELTDSVIKTVHRLEAVSHMPFYEEDALEGVQAIHKQEEKTDKIKRKFMQDLVEKGDQLSLPQFYLVTEITRKLEDIADKCEEAGAIMEVIIASP